MRYLTLLLLTLSFTAVFAQDDSKLPPDAQKIVAAFDAAAAKLRADVEKQIDKKALDAISDLRKAQENATKKNDLDGAVAIKAKIAALVPKDMPEIKSGPKDPAAMIGKWMMSGAGNGAAWVIKAKGQATSGEGFDGNYKVKEDKIVITWSNGQIDTMVIQDASAQDTTGTSGRGADLKFHRMTAP